MRYLTLDVFTSAPFGGNQLAVFPDATGIPEDLLLPITREFNFSEVTFCYPPADASHTRRVRIFTPEKELPFAGHPVVGTAVALALREGVLGKAKEGRITFELGVGVVPVDVRATSGTVGWAELSVAKLPEITRLERVSVGTYATRLSALIPAPVFWLTPIALPPRIVNPSITTGPLALSRRTT